MLVRSALSQPGSSWVICGVFTVVACSKLSGSSVAKLLSVSSPRATSFGVSTLGGFWVLGQGGGLDLCSNFTLLIGFSWVSGVGEIMSFSTG